MAKRINVSIRNLTTGEAQTQAVNQEGKELTELTGEAFNKHALRLIERTVHRFYGPNSAMVMTGAKAKGKNAGYEGFVGHKANWGGDDRPRLFNRAQKVLVTFETEEGQAILPVIIEEAPIQVTE
jgi:hypothetical protein